MLLARGLMCRRGCGMSMWVAIRVVVWCVLVVCIPTHHYVGGFYVAIHTYSVSVLAFVLSSLCGGSLSLSLSSLLGGSMVR